MALTVARTFGPVFCALAITGHPRKTQFAIEICFAEFTISTKISNCTGSYVNSPGFQSPATATALFPATARRRPSRASASRGAAGMGSLATGPLTWVKMGNCFF